MVGVGIPVAEDARGAIGNHAHPRKAANANIDAATAAVTTAALPTPGKIAVVTRAATTLPRIMHPTPTSPARLLIHLRVASFMAPDVTTFWVVRLFATNRGRRTLIPEHVIHPASHPSGRVPLVLCAQPRRLGWRPTCARRGMPYMRHGSDGGLGEL